jgi:hypothetical protein
MENELAQMGLNGIGAFEPAAARMARLPGWTDAERDRHVEDCKAIRARAMRAITQIRGRRNGIANH